MTARLLPHISSPSPLLLKPTCERTLGWWNITDWWSFHTGNTAPAFRPARACSLIWKAIGSQGICSLTYRHGEKLRNAEFIHAPFFCREEGSQSPDLVGRPCALTKTYKDLGTWPSYLLVLFFRQSWKHFVEFLQWKQALVFIVPVQTGFVKAKFTVVLSITTRHCQRHRLWKIYWRGCWETAVLVTHKVEQFPQIYKGPLFDWLAAVFRKLNRSLVISVHYIFMHDITPFWLSKGRRVEGCADEKRMTLLARGDTRCNWAVLCTSQCCKCLNGNVFHRKSSDKLLCLLIKFIFIRSFKVLQP